MTIRICGTNHRLAPVELREKLALDEERQAKLLRAFAELEDVREAALISTCNRVELIYVSSSNCRAEAEDALATAAGLFQAQLSPHLLHRERDEAVRHLFRVCSSLDSMVLGESQINGQVKDAYRLAFAAETLGPILHRLFHKAFAVAKRVRSETGVGASTLSVARAAVDMTRAVFDELSEHTVLLLGAGEMAESALKAFEDHGCRDLWVSSRTLDRAAAIAAPREAGVLPWARRVDFLEQADIVLASTGARSPILMAEDVRAARKKRRGRPLLLIDISVPRNLDPNIGGLDSVYLFDIDDLGKVVESGQASRQREAQQAEVLVEGEVASFGRILSQVHVAPVLRALQRKAADAGETEIERTMANLGPLLRSMDQVERNQVEEALRKMSASVTKRLLHEPIASIKSLGESGSMERIREAAELLGVELPLLAVSDRPTDVEEDPELLHKKNS